jgi:hypothetical protein
VQFLRGARDGGGGQGLRLPRAHAPPAKSWRGRDAGRPPGHRCRRWEHSAALCGSTRRGSSGWRGSHVRQPVPMAGGIRAVRRVSACRLSVVCRRGPAETQRARGQVMPRTLPTAAPWVIGASTKPARCRPLAPTVVPIELYRERVARREPRNYPGNPHQPQRYSRQLTFT